jgi:hypothetical protein
MRQSERLYAGKHPAPRAVDRGTGEGVSPSPHKPAGGHKQSHDPPLAKSGRFSWEMLDAMLH